MDNTFWDFKDDEEPLFRVMRTVAACTSGFRPEAPFGNCRSCPTKRACHAITTGLLAAAKHKMVIRAALRR